MHINAFIKKYPPSVRVLHNVHSRCECEGRWRKFHVFAKSNRVFAVIPTVNSKTLPNWAGSKVGIKIEHTKTVYFVLFRCEHSFLKSLWESLKYIVIPVKNIKTYTCSSTFFQWLQGLIGKTFEQLFVFIKKNNNLIYFKTVLKSDF